MKRYLVVTIISFFSAAAMYLLLVGSAHGQLRELEVKPEDPPATIPVFRNFPDQAAVIIYSSLTNLDITSNMGIVEDMSSPADGRYVLLIGPFRQILTVRASGFQETRIPIPNMNAREVAYFSVEPKEREPVTGRGTLLLRSIPEGAVITVDGYPDFNQATPYTFDDWAAQSYRIRLELDRYQPKELMISIPEEQIISRTVELTPNFGYVIINEPGNLRVRYQGEESFTRIPYEPNRWLELPVGRHELELSRDYHSTFREEISIFSGETINWEVHLEPTHGFLSINYDGEVRYREEGQSSWSRTAYQAYERLGLPEGRYEVELHRNFYETESTSVAIELGGRVDWHPDTRPQYGRLRVRAHIPVDIEVEDNLAPPAPPGSDHVNVETGRKRVVVSAPEYVSESFYVSVPAGGVFDTTLTLMATSAAEELERRRELPRGVIMAAADLDDVEIWIDGEMAGQGQVSRTVITGKHTVEFRYRSKQTRRSVYVAPAGIEQIFTEFRPLKSTAVFLGMLMPGAGHIYTRQSRGYLYGALFLGAAAGTVAMRSHHRTLEDRYELAMDRYQAAYSEYLNASSVASAIQAREHMLSKYGEAMDLHDDRSQAYRLTGYLAAGAAAVYLVNLVDVLFTRPPQGYRTGRPPEGFSASVHPLGEHGYQAVFTYRHRF